MAIKVVSLSYQRNAQVVPISMLSTTSLDLQFAWTHERYCVFLRRLVIYDDMMPDIQEADDSSNSSTPATSDCRVQAA
jgi:hypothetical protein